MKELDLNLLRLVVALERTRHLGRAAEAVGMSQSGFSTALARLRRQTADELFVRGGGGMRPTPRALTLAEVARAVLQQVDQEVHDSASFNPATSDVAFRLSMSDVAEAVFIPTLIDHLGRCAPGTSVQIASSNTTPLHSRLADGDVDLAIGYFPDLERDAYFRQPLFEHTYACILRRGHPRLRNWSKATFAALDHAVVASPARSTSLLDQAIERERIRRRIVLSTPNHLSLPRTIERTDLVATLPLGTAADAARVHHIVVMPLPFKPPSFPIHQYWHRRTHGEPGLQWLRGQMKMLFNPASDPYAKDRDALYPALKRMPASSSSRRRRA